MPKIPSSKESKKIYSHDELQEMNRGQIQATAKAWGVKANMKTKDIIARLLDEMAAALNDDEDEVQEISRPSREVSGTSPSLTRRNIPVKVEEEEDSTPEVLPKLDRAVWTTYDDVTKEWRSQVTVFHRKPGVPEPRTPPPPASRIPARSGQIVSPHPNHAVFSPRSARRIAGPIPWPREPQSPRNVRPQPAAGPSTFRPATLLPNTQRVPKTKEARALAGHEVRRMLRHMKGLVNQQAAERAEATSIIGFRQFLQNESDELMEKIDELAWGYAAIERTVMDLMRSDPTLVDGTDLMEDAGRKAEWFKYVKENYVPIDARVNERQAMIDDEMEEEEADKENDMQPASSSSEFRCEPQAFGSASRSLPAASSSYRSQPQAFVYDEDDDMSD